MVLTDLNYADVLPKLSTIQLASLVESMPPKQWMADEIRKRIRTEPHNPDWFFSYLKDCCDSWIESQNKPVKYRHCC